MRRKLTFYINLHPKFFSALSYSLIKYLALAFGFLKNLINAKFLGPEQLGVLGGILLLITYLGYTDFGVLHSMNREYPLIALKDKLGGDRVLNTTFTFLFCSSGAVVLLALVYLKFSSALNLSNSRLIFMGIITSVLEQYARYFINYYRLKNKILHINRIELIRNLLGLILTVALISYLKIFGVLLSLILCDIVVFLYGYHYADNIKLLIDKKVLKTLVTIGVPLLIYNLGFSILSTIDRISILNFLSKTDMGVYTLANQLASAVLLFLTSILFLYYPDAIQKSNISTTTRGAIFDSIKTYSQYLEFTGVALITLGLVFIYPFIIFLLPSFSDTIDIYNILVLGVIISRISYFYNVCIVSNKLQNRLVSLQFLAIGLAVLLNLFFLLLGFGLKGVAIATTMVNMFYTYFQMAIAYDLLEIKNKYFQAYKDIRSIFTTAILMIAFSYFKINYLFYVLLSLAAIGYLYISKLIAFRSKISHSNEE